MKIRRNSRSCILISQKDKTEYPFLAYTDADTFLDRKHGYVRTCVRNGSRISKIHGDGEIEYFEIIEGEKNRTITMTERFPEQLCWRCKNACGGCSWSRAFAPVPGWTALRVFKDRSWTYCITGCPEFKPEKRRKTFNEKDICDYSDYRDALESMWMSGS